MNLTSFGFESGHPSVRFYLIIENKGNIVTRMAQRNPDDELRRYAPPFTATRESNTFPAVNLVAMLLGFEPKGFVV